MHSGIRLTKALPACVFDQPARRQLYLAILIGRLVGAYVTQLGKRD